MTTVRGDASVAKEGDSELPAGTSVVVPVFNAEATLPELLEQLHTVLDALERPYEIILVDDGSRDGSWRIIEQAAATGRARGVALMRNAGQHNALLCGVRLARYATTVTLDDDLQHPPDQLPRLLERLQPGDVDLVYGVPIQPRHAAHRRWGSWLLRQALAAATTREMARSVNSFRAFRTDLRRAFADFSSPAVVLDVLLSWGTNRVGAVSVPHRDRAAGRSNYSAAGLLRAALIVLTAFSTAPLRVASLLGLLMTLFGAAILAYVLSTYFLEGSLPGFPFLASLAAIFGGAQLFALGILGEYLAQIFERSMHRPSYTVGATTDRIAFEPQPAVPPGTAPFGDQRLLQGA
jgi:undecaprenyl-phosphate 4-deoxy-4-formamido-L-arabinose transferase